MQYNDAWKVALKNKGNKHVQHKTANFSIKWGIYAHRGMNDVVSL